MKIKKSIILFFLIVISLTFQNCGGTFESEDLEEVTSVAKGHDDVGFSEDSIDIVDMTENLESDPVTSKATVSIKSPSSSPKSKKPRQESAVFKLYISPYGNDKRSGESLKESIKTLSRAHKIISSKKPNKNVEILVDKGSYVGQIVRWTYVNKNYSVTIKPGYTISSSNPRPKFVGCLTAKNCKIRTWFSLSHSKGTPSNINIRYLHIKNYHTAISLNGSRKSDKTSNSNNTIYGNIFERIGNVFAPALKPSTAAIRLVNSKSNLIRNNHFRTVVNKTGAELIHAVYLAHYSSDNKIVYNRFNNVSGSTVKVRDSSNHNFIDKNNFQKIDFSAYDEWYCEKNINSACTKIGPECPSQGNWFRSNTIGDDRKNRSAAVFRVRGADHYPGCPKRKLRRLRTSSNIRN